MNWIQQFFLDNQVAIVTGASGGLGQQLVNILLDANAYVVLVDNNKSRLEEFSQKLPSRQILSLVGDVSYKNDILKIIANTHQKFGKIDILINCAGVLGPDVSMFNVSENDWDQVMAANVKGTWLASTEIAKYMIEHKIKGSIVNISSSLGLCAQQNRIAYAPSKAAVEHLTRNMAMELVKYNIRVNCLAPGWMNTPMTQSILEGPNGKKWCQVIPMRRAADPEELAGPILLLASQASSYMTGSILRVDGGYSYCGIELPED